MGSPLRSTVSDMLSGLSRFRILVVGKSGSGKTALLSKVFGVDMSPGNVVLEKIESTVFPRIQGGIMFRGNSKFILYTSPEDFLPNSDTDFDGLRDFIQARVNSDDPQKKLHAIWICVDTPLGGERLYEGGMERVLGVAHKKVPVIIVLTKFDRLVTATEKTSGNVSDDEGDAREMAECLLDDTLKKLSLDSLLGQQLVTPVSVLAGYDDTISTLIQSTDGAIQKFNDKRAHDLPIALAWAIAQRQDLETKVAATIDVGGKRYWSGLGGATEFNGRTLQQCISVIHKDIVTIWNIEESPSYLEREDFKARLSHLVEELACTSWNDKAIPTSPGATASATFAAAIANPIAAIGAVAEAAKWVSDVYQATHNTIACIMGYIVDLSIVLVFLSEIRQFQEVALHGIEEDSVNAIKAYISSGLLSEAHEEIRKFVSTDKWREMTRQEDPVLGEMKRLVNKFHPRASDSVRKASERPQYSTVLVKTISDEPPKLYTREGSIQSHLLGSVNQRAVYRHTAQEAPLDILTIVEEATRIPSSRSSSEGSQRPALLIPETSPAESSKHSPLNPLKWIRRERPGADEEAGKA